jgi:hypothetical protein
VISLAARVRTAIRKPFLPVFFFFGGVTFDSLTLTRIDRLSDNLVLLCYLIALGVLVVLVGSGERAGLTESAEKSAALEFGGRARPYFPLAIQFLLGGLFSAYAIFYSKSASLTTTAIFFVLLIVLLVGNELWHDHVTNLRIMVALYALAAVSFFAFFLPVVTGVMNDAMFLLSATLGVILAIGIVVAVCRRQGPVIPVEVLRNGLPAMTVVGGLVLLYFLNWIPPVPLSMSFGGAYQHVTRAGDVYELGFEKGPWYQFWKRSDDLLPASLEAYCFTAIFAPVHMRTRIYHHWQYYQPESGRYVTTDRIPVPIVGGRSGGYRAYSVKQSLFPGDWRVNVETADARIIGRVSFRVENRDAASNPDLERIFY